MCPSMCSISIREDLAELAELAQKDQFHIVDPQESLNVFSNPNTAGWSKLVAPGTSSCSASCCEFCVAGHAAESGAAPGHPSSYW